MQGMTAPITRSLRRLLPGTLAALIVGCALAGTDAAAHQPPTRVGRQESGRIARAVAPPPAAARKQRIWPWEAGATLRVAGLGRGGERSLAGDVVLRLRLTCALSPLVPVADLVTVTAAGAVVRGPTFSRHALLPPRRAGVSSFGVAALLAAAEDIGLAGDLDLGQPTSVADACTHHLTLSSEDGPMELSAYGLDAQFDGLVSPAQARARARLRGFLGSLESFGGPGLPYAAPVEFHWRGRPIYPYTEGPTMGWTLDWVPAAPMNADSDACTVVSAPAALAQLYEITDGVSRWAFWRMPHGDGPVHLALRPLPPGDPGCTRARPSST